MNIRCLMMWKLLYFHVHVSFGSWIVLIQDFIVTLPGQLGPYKEPHMWEPKSDLHVSWREWIQVQTVPNSCLLCVELSSDCGKIITQK